MKEIREYLSELESISTKMINLEYVQNKTYQTLIDRILLNCRTNIHPDVLVQLDKTKKIIKIGYWVHDIKKKLYMGTKELLQFMGKDPKRESFTEEEFFMLIDKEDLPIIQKSYAEDILAHEDRASAYRITDEKLKVKYVVSHFSTKYDEQDNPIQVTGIIFEIPQNEDNKSYTDINRKNSVISDNMNVGFWEYDPKSGTEYWSSSLYDIIETTPEECPAKISSLEHLLSPKHLDSYLELITNCNNKNKDYESTFKIITKQGKEKIIFSQVRHLVGIDGNLIKRYGLVYDVTKIKQLLIK